MKYCISIYIYCFIKHDTIVISFPGRIHMFFIIIYFTLYPILFNYSELEY